MPKGVALLLFVLISYGLHCGDIPFPQFTTLYEPLYPYFFGVLSFGNPHIPTQLFIQPVSVDVSFDVSDVSSTSFMRRLCCLKIAVQIGKFAFSQLPGHISIDVQGCRNVGMSKSVLYHLHIDARPAHSGREGMSQGMAAKVRQQYSGIGIFVLKRFLILIKQKHFAKNSQTNDC